MKIDIKKADTSLQIVYGEVYAPDLPDVQGGVMSVDEIRKAAHTFLRNNLGHEVDTNHDNDINGAYVVESFIARDDDPIYIPNSWVVGVHVPSETLWAQVLNGQLNGFSMEALVNTNDLVVEIEVPSLLNTTTIEDNSGHTHSVMVRFADDGTFLGGSTSTDEGHAHSITGHTVTDTTDSHTHRFSIMEAVKYAEV